MMQSVVTKKGRGAIYASILIRLCPFLLRADFLDEFPQLPHVIQIDFLGTVF